MSALIRLVTVVLVAGFVAGCAVASSGRQFSMAEADQLKPGVSTYDDAVARLGPPVSIINQPDGQRIAVWTYGRATAVYVVASGTRETVSFLFDTKGVMVRMITRSSSRSGVNYPS